jgi:tetratricopeptide (TPR) repeat protein
MKYSTISIILSFLISSCDFETKDWNSFTDDIRKDFAEHAQKQNEEVYDWESKIQELYKRADSLLIAGVNYGDSLIQYDKSLDKWEVSNIHTIIGEIYFDNDSIKPALRRFKIVETLTHDSPRNKANKAGCYIKLGYFKKAMSLLKQAAEDNHDFKWYVGNLYEIKGFPDSAILEYNYVYKRDTIVYAYFKQRILELKENPDSLLTELHYKDRRKRTYILLHGVGPND